MLRRTEISTGNMIFFILAVIIVTAIWRAPEDISLAEITGRIIIVTSCFTILYLFLFNFYFEVLKVPLKTLFILFQVISFVVLTRLALEYPDRNLLPLIPFALIPIMTGTFYDSRLAVFILLVTATLTAFFVPEPFEFAFMNSIAGLAAIYTLTDSHRKAKFFITAFYVVLSYVILYTGFRLLMDGDFSNFIVQDLIAFAGNGLLVLLSYPLIFIFEMRFKFLSDSTLLELADTNQPLLRKLADEAPGSFQHSLQVANLAEEAARITGSNPLLVRTGAMYHDIGKISGPGYFVENQKNGVSPHDTLDPEVSVRYIINHVDSGVVLAKNFKLPSQILDFIRTHHGTSVAYYFFKKYTDKKPRDSAAEKAFAYPGPKPFTKETAIVMMADAVEASSRSIEKQTEDSISELVERIILLQEQDGQYSEVPFTYKDISDIKEAFKKRLSTMYHGRIVYPPKE